MSSDDDFIFFRSPFPSFYVRVQVVVPSLPTLLADSSWKLARNYAPIFWSVLFHQCNHFGIFIFCPRPFHEIWIQYFLPPMKTLNISSIWEVGSNLFPVFSLKVILNLLQIFKPAARVSHPLLSSNIIFSLVLSSSVSSRPTSCFLIQNPATFTHFPLSPPRSVSVFP